MASFPFSVTDNQGNPIEGAEISIQINTGPCAGSKATGYTNASGAAAVDDGCYFPSTVAYTVSAIGFQPQSGTANGWGGAHTVQVALPRITEPGAFGCPQGYVNINGQCVQASATNLLQNLLSAIKNNWLLILVLLFGVVFAFLLLWRPRSAGNVIRAVKQ